jgi:hypothetical protein
LNIQWCFQGLNGKINLMAIILFFSAEETTKWGDMDSLGVIGMQGNLSPCLG